MAEPHPTQGARRADLEERLQAVRRELVRREESPAGSWIEDSARDLAAGAKPGWYFPERPEDGIAFYARRGSAAYGHVHSSGANGPGAADALARALLGGLPADVRSINVGFSGLPAEAENALAHRLGQRPGSRVIERQVMEYALTSADEGAAPETPRGLQAVGVRDVTLEALTDLDWRSFRGTADELLVGTHVDEYRYVLETILAGQLGRFVDEASIALIEPAPIRLVAAVLTAEQTIRRAILVDLLVDPERQRRGYGRFLLRWTLRSLRGLGYDSARLWVTKENTPALALYAKFGFHAGAEAAIYRWERPGSDPQPHSPR